MQHYPTMSRSDVVTHITYMCCEARKTLRRMSLQQHANSLQRQSDKPWAVTDHLVNTAPVFVVCKKQNEVEKDFEQFPNTSKETGDDCGSQEGFEMPDFNALSRRAIDMSSVVREEALEVPDFSAIHGNQLEDLPVSVVKNDR